MISRIYRMVKLVVEKFVYFGGLSKYIAVNWLLRIYKSQFKLDWVFNKNPPHFYDHRMGIMQFAFGEITVGPYAYFRGFFATQVIQEGDRLLDIECGDGFFDRRFFFCKV